MGTASMIAYENADGTVKATYCHYDGYISYNGKLLVRNYSESYDAEAVASAGYLSGLTENLYEDLEKAVHKNQSPEQYSDRHSYLANAGDYFGAEYLYLYDPQTNEWLVADLYGDEFPCFKPVEYSLDKEAA